MFNTRFKPQILNFEDAFKPKVAVFTWNESNGALVGGHETTRNLGVGNVNWKNVDDVATAYSSSPITAGNNSFGKYQFGIFSGSFNQISDGKFQHVSGTFGAGLTLRGFPTGTYATPSTTAIGAPTADLTPTGDIATGIAVLFGAVPEQGLTGTLSASGTTSYLLTQLK